MKNIQQKVFNNLVHDLGVISQKVLNTLNEYDNIRIIPLSKVDNKQPYNIE